MRNSLGGGVNFEGTNFHRNPKIQSKYPINNLYKNKKVRIVSNKEMFIIFQHIRYHLITFKLNNSYIK